MKKKGKKFGNAEVTIDMRSKKIKFNYPNKQYNPNLSFFCHYFYNLVGTILGAISGFHIPIKWLNSYGYSIMDINIFFYIIYVTIIVLSLLGGLTLFGYISLFLHKFSKTARDSFPKTNAITKTLLASKRKINLENKISRVHYITGKKLIIFNYGIVLFDYCYIGNNKIRKILTKSIEYNIKQGEEHTEFIVIFLFEKPIKEGILYYKT